jgi:glycosyltransferase involved in cell wall biosynthesis
VKITLCILARNERPCIEVMLPRLPAPGPAAGYDEIVAIDGGSTDGTVEYFQQRGIRVIGQSRRGRGDAFLQAFQKLGSDAFIFFSPDGNEEPADLARFRPLLESGADLVIASRMMPGSINEEDAQLLRFRKWANLAFNWMANQFFRREGPYVTDSINGFRAITASAARRLRLDAVDYTIEYQMTIRALKARLRVVEFPTREGQRIAGETGARSLPTGIRFLRRLWTEARAKPAA